MALYQNSVLNKYLKGLESEKVSQAYERFKSHFHNPTIQENIRNSKEEQYQGEFLIDLFVNVLGYTKNPTPDFNLTTELKNIKGSKKTDGAILKGEKALAVIELKGTNTTDLSKVETQAFGYKNNQPGCNYVITSNFEKLRFYIDNAVDFEEFNLFQLTKERFDMLWLCLSADYLLKDTPKKIKDESLTQEENVTKKLYKDYASFRNEIFDAIQKENPEYDKLTLFKKTQKLLDRFLFIFFAEDRLLLPPNSIRVIVKQWKTLKDELDAYVPLYDRFKKYFGYMNTGHKGQQHDIFAYNGGLFAPDEILDNIKINDDLLYKHTVNLSNYDFESEVSVNILGHIFEHSLNDIDEIQAEIQGTATEQSKTKRKKDGVFYTPKYITKYIVDNTVGKLCEEKKTEIDIQEAEYEKERKGRQKATLKKLSQKLEDYRKWLLQITICDPACGSGAFLNQALEFLIAEHQYIDELQAKLFGDAMILSEVENAILENNLFGVDINEESVEIAKLSLWLRTAQKGRKLTSLNNNIKCGNSLIDDPTVAGDKAFNWQNEFPEVFLKGGFDVIIGNPPYVVLSSFESDEFEYLQNRYKTSYGRLNLFSLFIEKCTEIIIKDGKVGLIIPDSLCLIDYYRKLRILLLDDFNINGLIELGDGVFDDATVPALILLFENSTNNDNYIITGTSKNVLLGYDIPKLIPQKLYYKTPKNSFNLYADELFVKINEMIDNNKTYALKDVLQIKIGVCTGGNKKHLNVEPIYSNSKKVLQGKDINRYKLAWGNMYINYSKSELLRSRDETIFIKEEKLLMRQTSDRLILTYDNEKYYTIDSLFIIFSKDEDLMLKYCLALLNSRLLNRQYQKLNPETGRVFAQVKIDYVNELPIIKSDLSSQQKLSNKVDFQIFNNKELSNLENQLISLIKAKYNFDKPAKKLKNWHELDSGEFLKELEKVRKKSAKEKETEYTKLSLSEEAEWMQYFNEQKQKAQELKTEIDKMDKEIDQMVYKLYGLSDEEIQIVEEATK